MAAVHHVHNKLSWEQVLEKFHEVHGNKYIYDEKSYKDTHTKMRMYCSETDEEGNIHGWFEQSPSKHIHLKQGCKKCAGVEKHTLESFKKAAIKVHGERFDLSGITEYVNNRGIVYPICHEKDENGVEHGAFSVTVHNFLRGRGCPKCKNKRISQSETKTTEEYIEQAKKIHGDDYDYINVIYTGSHEYIYPICHKKDGNGNEHGVFKQQADSHLRGCGCPKCGKLISSNEVDISNYIENELHENVVRNDRNIIGGGKEIDILIPSKNIGFEYDGMIWHSEKFNKENKYHLNKTLKSKENGIKLFHIYESEFLLNKEIVKHKIAHILGHDNGIKIGARKCKIIQIDKIESEKFLNQYHLQGYISSSVYLGAYYNDTLVGVMCFKQYGKKWELTRYCTNFDYNCQGLGSKLFKYFTRNYEYDEVKSFADRRWTVDEKDNLYTKLGFELSSILKPDYAYTKLPTDYIHKFNFRKQILHKKYGFPLTMTETEMATKLGYYKIWNCGLLKYVYKNPDK